MHKGEQPSGNAQGLLVRRNPLLAFGFRSFIRSTFFFFFCFHFFKVATLLFLLYFSIKFKFVPVGSHAKRWELRCGMFVRCIFF